MKYATLQYDTVEEQNGLEACVTLQSHRMQFEHAMNDTVSYLIISIVLNCIRTN